ncbi:NEL-type E3 ubiquitin ligase domain-containing protein [Pseudomonas sp. NPDC089407]|uniref:NEL-type E3 ubiquitin ligase domain-containing protein n=1 Tax=Pseudomonas sp. NPDC089407 TaxID=3364464 RepID=UPI00384AC281
MTSVQGAVDTQALEQGFQDGLIAHALPAWLRNLRVAGELTQARSTPMSLTPTQLTALLEALKTSLLSWQRLTLELQRIVDILPFCKPLLERALNDELGYPIANDGLHLRHHYFSISPKPDYPFGRLPQQQEESYDVPLLTAALANFTEGEARGDELPRHDRLVDRGGAPFAPMTADAFARCSRRLDLGGRYQQHLDGILSAPASATASGYDVMSSLQGLHWSSMLIDACRARSEGRLTADDLESVLALCREGQPRTVAGLEVRVRQLTVYGCRLEQIVVLDIFDNFVGFKSSTRLLVYIPDDPVSPWSTATDLDAFVRWTLGKRLAEQPYQQFFSRFVRRRDRPGFFARVGSELKDVADWASRDMDQHLADYPLPLFPCLAQAWIDQFKDDAAFIAVPVAQVDRQVEQARQDRLLNAAWMIAGVVGLFVPGVNNLLVAAAGWGLLKEVFHAVEAWREDDCRAVLDHVLDVVRQVVELGITAVVMRTVRRQWSLADPLVTARLEGGGEKLWRFDLQPFRSAPPPVQATADALGVYRLAGRSWVKMEGAFFEVLPRADGEWQIKPVEGHGPLLRHNDAGAWRVWCEQPVEWDDVPRMFNRLGGAFSQVPAEQVDPVMAIHDIDADHVRGLHVCNRAPDPCLVDTVNRVAMFNRIQRLVNQLRSGEGVEDEALLARVRQWGGGEALANEGLADEVWRRRHSLLRQLYYEQNPVTADTRELRRDFPGLHQLAAQALLDAAGHEQTYHAGELARRIRRVRVRESLLFDLPQNLDTARTVLAAIEQLPGAEAGPSWQLIDGSALQPLASTAGVGPALRLRFAQGLFQLEDPLGEVSGSSSCIFEVLGLGCSAGYRQATGVGEPFAQGLRIAVAQRVMEGQLDIAEVLKMKRPVGLFLPPQRLDQNRIGYPLCTLRNWLAPGRRGALNLAAELRDLYPGFSDEQIDDWLAMARRSNTPPAAKLLALKQQLKTLTRQLRSWKRATPKLWAWRSRSEFARGLLDCWRRLLPSQLTAAGNAYELTSFASNLDELPVIPASVDFSHVTSVSLRTLQLRRIPDDFLQAFRALTSLNVTHCRLRSLPLSAGLAERLEVLDLCGNQIRLDGRATDLLARCRSLVYLNLSDNPLRRRFSLQQMQQLRVLMLGNTQLQEVPESLMQATALHTLDLGDNQIRTLPFGFYQSALWRSRRVRLAGNPLEGVQDTWSDVTDEALPTQLHWLDLVNGKERDRLAHLWSGLKRDRRSVDFFNLLGRLASSADTHTEALARYLALRVRIMIDYMSARPALQTELYAHSLTEHCQDNATLRFSDLEVRVKVWKAMHEPGVENRQRALLYVGGQCWRLEVLDELASLHAIGDGNAEESLEYALAYRLGLVEQLDLPIEHDEMLNPRVAALSAHDLARAAHHVRRLQTVDALADFLLRQRFWTEYLAQTHEASLQVPQSLHDEVEALDARGAPKQEYDQLQARMQQRMLHTQRQLTREAISSSLPAVALRPPVPLG